MSKKKDIMSQPIVEQFNEKRGIITPIRTCVHQADYCDLVTLNGFLESVAKKETNAIVGYFAVTNDFDPECPEKSIGFSFIHPEDYAFSSNMDINKIRAIVMSMNKNKAVSKSALSKKHALVDTNSGYAYIFHETIKEQYDRFVDRCKRYYKK